MTDAEREELKQIIREVLAEPRRRERLASGGRVDPWEARIGSWLASLPPDARVTTGDAAAAVGVPLEAVTRAATTRLGTIMRRAGWLPKTRAICNEWGSVVRRERAYGRQG